MNKSQVILKTLTELGYSDKNIGDKIGVTEETIARVRTGKYIGRQILPKLQALNVPSLPSQENTPQEKASKETNEVTKEALAVQYMLNAMHDYEVPDSLLAKELGKSSQYIGMLRRGDKHSHAMFKSVMSLYEEFIEEMENLPTEEDETFETPEAPTEDSETFETPTTFFGIPLWVCIVVSACGMFFHASMRVRQNKQNEQNKSNPT